VEDELVSRIKSKAVASYTLLSAQAISSASNEPLNNVLNEGKFTHVLMMLLTDVQDETYYVPGSTSVYYGGYGSYYGYGAAYYSDPGYYTTYHNYFVEIRFILSTLINCYGRALKKCKIHLNFRQP
jgi:hypothetical protein